MRARGDAYVRSADPENPTPGDLRVRFEIVRPGPATVIAGLENASLVPWQDPWLGPVYRVEENNEIDPLTLLPPVEEAATFKIWAFRLLSFLTQALGCFWLTAPLFDHLLHLAPRIRPPSGPGFCLTCSLGLSLLLAALTWASRIPEFSLSILILFLLAGGGYVLQTRGLKFRHH